MAVSLTKGSSISLTKQAPSLARISMGLGWDPAKKGGGFLGKLFGGGGSDSIDLDASCLAFAGGRHVDTAYFGRLDILGGAIHHNGDNLTGDGDGDDEVIDIDTTRLPAEIDALVLTVNSFRGQTFDEVDNAFCRVVDQSNGRELARFTLAEKGRHTGVVMAVLRRAGSSWDMQAIGRSAHGRTAADLVGPARECL
ncbi:TerD family protein [Methylorubrum extorquens]|uniref:TerD family protein n=1 Tax=Methylorubrum extorquens TaxID=408 RepID=UPI001477C2B0|nr:TerD family protein [Methylorubrum extorquens]MCP1538207.1 tellurium resistance protein TerZ [Methylorubrum extorquens]MCP1558568.1 tellurium resistance protein TerZ [Methylorubrum extorquens]MDH6637478.1 tellurium resistance protein TerZ [Methylobacterium sp. SuP10 SLI 274]MDH6666658.1 tellurium resistance protein TerZ [Methylorubrum zatmanii]